MEDVLAITDHGVKILSGDILRVQPIGSEAWEDFAVIESHADAVAAVRRVHLYDPPGTWNPHPNYRIERDGRVAYDGSRGQLWPSPVQPSPNPACS